MSYRCGRVTDTPCKDCGVCPERWVDYDVCSVCSGSGHDEIGNPCLHCDRGEETIETVACACEDDDE